MEKKTKEINYWTYRPGFNILVGYKEGTIKTKSGGIKEVDLDRTVKDGKSLNK